MNWKKLPLDTRYLVSDTGLVKGLDGRILKQATDTNGYKFVTLNNNYKQFHLSIHRAVALAFIPNPLNLPCVNHIDEDKSNNNLSNLEWCTHKQNSDHSVSKKVLMLDKHTEEVIMEFKSLRDANKYFGTNVHSSISAVCRGLPKYKTVKGYKWRYK